MTEDPQDQFDQEVGRGLVAALLFVKEHVEKWPTLDDVLHLHRLIFQCAHPEIGGQYRSDTYWPQYTHFVVPSWQEVPTCMLRLEDLLIQAKVAIEAATGFEEQELLLEWTARIHHRFECIHPFQDGNGRTGRALATWMLTHYGFPAFDLPIEEKAAYIDALSRADDALKTQDLLHADFWPHQTEALQPLIGLTAEVLSRSVLIEQE